VNQLQESGREHVAEWCEHEEREDDRGQKSLVHDTIHLLVIVCSGEARDEHAHAGEQRADEDDHDEEDLPAHADRGVPGETNVVADHHVIDDALQPADHVLHDGRPRETPDRAGNRPLDYRSIEFGANGCRFGGRRRVCGNFGGRCRRR